MSIEVRVPKEINEYKEKIIFGLSIRQLICFSLALIIGVLTYMLHYKFEFISKDMMSYIVILEVMPIFAIGFIKINGFTFEKYMLIMINHFFNGHKYIYKTNIRIDEIDNKKGKNNVQFFFAKKRRNFPESERIQVREKSKKRKSKEISKSIKIARKEYEKEKSKLNKTL